MTRFDVSGLPAEDRLLLLCAHVKLALPDQEALQELARGPLDWDRVMAVAVRQGIVTLVFYHLNSLRPYPPIPPRVLLKLEQIYRAAQLLGMRQRYEYARLVDALRLAGITTILLKGLALREVIYPDPALRPSGDIDLLVPPDTVEQTEQILQGLGYIPDDKERPRHWYRPETYHHLVPYRLPGREVQVEIHWALAPPKANLQIAIEDLWQRAIVVQAAGRPARLLSPEDLLIHLSLHALVLDRFLTRLHHLVDIAEAVRHYGPQLDWSRAITVAKRWGVQGHLYCALRAADELLDLEGLTQTLPNLRPIGFDETLVATVRQQVLTIGHLPAYPWTTDHVTAFWLADSAGEKLKLLWRILFPSRRRMADLYHVSPGSRRLMACYLIRPIQLLFRYGRHIRLFSRVR